MVNSEQFHQETVGPFCFLLISCVVMSLSELFWVDLQTIGVSSLFLFCSIFCSIFFSQKCDCMSIVFVTNSKMSWFDLTSMDFSEQA